MVVVPGQCLVQRPGRHAEPRLHVGHGLVAVEERHQRHLGLLHVRAVDYEVGRGAGLFHHELRCPGVIGVLGHETLATGVDDEPGDQHRGRVERRGDERLVHVPQARARRHPEPDAKTVVVRRAERDELRGQRRGVPGDHLGVHHETPGGDHGRAGPDHPGVAERTPGQPHDGAGLAGHQAGRAGLVPHLDAGVGDPVA
jgi:hypothetical protein